VSRQRARFHADQRDRLPTKVRVEHDDGLGVVHVGPPLQRGVVGVGHPPQHRAYVEGFLALAVGRWIEDLGERGEVAARPEVRRRGDVTVGGVGSWGDARETLTRRGVRVLVVGE
jgi:hypothetical protein